MEDVKVREFLAVSSGSGWGSGCGDGSGSGWGDGWGSGDGFGWDSGWGSGWGSGDGVKSINGNVVYDIDGVQTIISRVRNGIAKGFIPRGDLTLKPCYVVKRGDTFAHGETLRAAMDALRDKLLENMPEEERIAEFIKTHEWGKVYPDKDYFEWHHRLTGSCEMGRMEFARERGLESLDGSRTVEEFIKLCENSYGGSTIKKLKEAYKEAQRS